MKKIILLIVSTLAAAPSSQAQSIEDFFEKYKANDEVRYVRIAPSALSVASKLAVLVATFDSDVPKKNRKMARIVSNLADDLDDVDFMFTKNDIINFQNKLKEEDLLADYRLLYEVFNKDEDIFIYSKVLEEDIVRSLFIVIADKYNDVTIVANLKGKMKLVKIAEIIEFSAKSSKCKDK